MNKNTYLYYRVSRWSQQTESQKLFLDEYCQRNDITGIPLEDKATGTNQQRKDFLKLMGEVKAGRVEAIYCYDISRIGRNLWENMEFAKGCLDRKVKLIGASDNCDITTKDGMLKYAILSGMAHYMRERIVENTILGLQARKEKYFKKFGTYDGWQGGSKKGSTSEKVRKILPKVYELMDLGMSNLFIAERLGLNWRTIARYKKMRGQPLKSRKQVEAEYRQRFNPKND